MKRKDRDKGRLGIPPPKDPTKANSNRGQPDDHKREVSGVIVVRGAIEVNLPPSLIDKHDTERKENRARERKKFWIEFLTLIGIGIYTGLTALLVLSSFRANKVSRESLESVQRAFIAYHSIEFWRGKSGDRIFWNIQPFYENDGATPAVAAISVYSIGEGKAEIPEEMFKYGKKEWPVQLPAATIAPKAQQGAAIFTLDESYIFGINLGDRFERIAQAHQRDDISIFGWMVYRDVLPNTKPHLTEFCMRPSSSGLIDENPPKIKFNMDVCPQHNCTDEYCPDYSEIVDFAESRIAK